MFKDELKSLEIELPQEQTYFLLDNGMSCNLPHFEHFFEVFLGFTNSNWVLASSALYTSNCLNLSQETSLIDNCKYLFFISDGFKSSKAIQSSFFHSVDVKSNSHLNILRANVQWVKCPVLILMGVSANSSHS